ncbi:ROK family glucokinase [Fundicoccus culcitae]|uniref:Glucokinase n=1 Tax=Fundicoccus culcitae TaxID=2969821 RepID=A0ABY5P7D5_9LACT|nr:ROK family glucokinase [Fundicoccus culcitae]UUX34579.1 ROK family glucokinase [Fundicoccus culcitae]
MSKYILGIDLGGTSVKMAVVTPEGEIMKKWSVGTNIINDGEAIVPDIINSIKEHLELYQLEVADFFGIGMGSPGVVDAENKTVVGAYNLNWTNVQYVGKQIAEAFNIPFYIDNDANVAALGEQWKGAGNGASNVVMVTLGTGIGGGVINEGKIVRGEGGGGEIGHLQITTDMGVQCTCGKTDCLEILASGKGIINLVRYFADRYEGDSKLKHQIDNGEDIGAEDIFSEAQKGDFFANEVVDQWAKYMGLACSHIANVVNPKYIILGGGVSAAGQYLIDVINPYFKKYVFPQIYETTSLRLASIGNDAGVIGAARLVEEAYS